MLSFTVVTAALAALNFATASITPNRPGPGDVFNSGANCPISWSLDTTGKWTSFQIDLMTGSNLAMQLVVNVAKGLDGTKGATGMNWTCPDVTPNSAIYFYQFTQAGSDTSWTTRFTIASPSGQVVPPANANQPEGAAIPWGTGKLTSGSTAAAPTTNVTVTPATNANLTALNTPATTTPVSNETTVPATTGASTSSTTPKTSTSSSTSSSAAGTKVTTGSSTASTPASGSASSNSNSAFVSKPRLPSLGMVASVILVTLL